MKELHKHVAQSSLHRRYSGLMLRSPAVRSLVCERSGQPPPSSLLPPPCPQVSKEGKVSQRPSRITGGATRVGALTWGLGGHCWGQSQQGQQQQSAVHPGSQAVDLSRSRTHAALLRGRGEQRAGGGRVWVREGCVCVGGVGGVCGCVCAHSFRVHIWFLLRIGENSTPEDLSPISVAGKRARDEHGRRATNKHTPVNTQETVA